jgi:hypothetical protein
LADNVGGAAATLRTAFISGNDDALAAARVEDTHAKRVIVEHFRECGCVR